MDANGLGVAGRGDRNYVSLIALGRNSPSVRLMFRLCDALDITPSDMLKDVERRMRVQGTALTQPLR